MEENRRAKDFENPFNHSQIKDIRSSTAVELRKSKREILTQKQRNITEAPEWVKLNNHYQEEYQESDLPEILSNLQVQSDHSFLFVAQAIRKVLTYSESSVGLIVTSEIMSHLKLWLSRDDFTQLQYESSWICTNISASDFCQVLDQSDLLPSLVYLLGSSRNEVMVQAAWSLGNIVANSPDERNKVYQLGGIPLLIKAFYEVNSNKRNTETILWTINNLLRKKPHLEYHLIRDAFTVLFISLFNKSLSSHIDICWSIKAYLNEEEIMNELMKKETLGVLKSLCYSPKKKLAAITLQIFGGIFYSSSVFSKIILEDNFASTLADCIKREGREVKRYAVWAVANLTGEKSNLLQYLFQASIFQLLFELIEKSHPIVISECCWAICNACVVCTTDEMVKLVEMGLIPSMACLLEKEINTGIVLEALITVLKVGQNFKTNEGNNLFAMALENCGGLELVRKYAVEVDREKICEKANKILDLLCENEDNDENLIDIVEDKYNI